MSKRYKLKFVNGGSPFEMPEWTVNKQEQLLELMIPLDEKLQHKLIKKDEHDRQFRLNMILLSLHDVDKNVKESDLTSLHPDDFIDLWVAVYNTGKHGIEANDNLDFPEGEKKNPQ